jgi:hypothetical protein
MMRSFALAPLGCIVVFLAGCGQSPAPTPAPTPTCSFDLSKSDFLPPGPEFAQAVAVIKEGLTCNVGATCCSTLHVALNDVIANHGRTLRDPQQLSAFVGKCGRKDQVSLFDCAKATYNKVTAALPPADQAHVGPFPLSGEPVADTSPDGVGTCQSKFGEISGLSTGCCTAVQAALKCKEPSDYVKLIVKSIGKCGVKDQDSLLALAKKKGAIPPQLQNLVEQITTAKVVAIDMMGKMIHGTSGQGATNSYQLGTIALFGGIGGIVGALSTLAIAKRYSSERMVIKSPLLA